MLGETLLREIEEETGITDTNVLEVLGEMPGAKEGDIVHLFLCETAQDARLMEPKKFSEWKWAPLSEMPESFINPAAFALVAHHCSQRL